MPDGLLQVGMTRADGISPYLKVTIDGQLPGIGRVSIVGYLGEGASATLTSHWVTPFTADTMGASAYMEKAAAITQAVTGLTSKHEFNSVMNWEGIESPALSLPLVLKAFSDAKAEVEEPIRLLKMLASPELNKLLPAGRVPQPVVVDIGRRQKHINVVIKSITEQLDGPRTNGGYRIGNVVALELQTKQMLNQSEINLIHN
jgi:hypothetical protein